jgi:DNA-directed RNA polymerase specialized sigma24 family protein
MTDHSFHTTRWSLVSRMRDEQDSAAARVALGDLCQRCWFPIYAFVRRSGVGAHDAEDLTQGFFQHLLTHDLMARAQREKGRFRSFLLGCLKHFLDNEWQKSTAQRRGGHLSPVHLDALAAEERYRVEIEAMSTDDDTAFDQQWAQGVLEQAVALLRSEQADAARFELLLPALTGTDDRAALIAATGLNEGTLKVAIHRLRRRYRELLWQIVADTVETEADVDEELNYLVACLRR